MVNNNNNIFKHAYFLVFLVCVSTFFHFVSGAPHAPVGADTYHFLVNSITHERSGMLLYDLGNVLGEQGLVLVSFIIGLIAVVCLYTLCYLFSRDANSSFFSTFLIMLMPWFFYKSGWYYVDKDMITLIFICLFMFVYLSKTARNFFSRDVITSFKIATVNTWLHRLTCILLIILFRYVWEAWYTLALVWLVMELLDAIKHKDRAWYIMLCVMTFFYTVFNYQRLHDIVYYTLFSADKLFIAEMKSPILLGVKPEYLLLFSVVFYFFYSVNRIKKAGWDYKRAWVWFWVILSLYMFSYRFIIYIIPVTAIMFAGAWYRFRQNEQYKMLRYLTALLLVCIAIMMASSVSVMPVKPVKTIDMDNVLCYNETAQNCSKTFPCLISVWDQGHYWDYVLRKQNSTAEVLYKAHGKHYKQQIRAYVLGVYNKSCRLVYNNDTVHDIKLFLKVDGIEINQSDWWIENIMG